MATIENNGVLDPALYRDMPDQMLVAQDLVQEGAVHAISFLLQHGCNEQTATQMLASLRENARHIRVEPDRRGASLFEQDQWHSTNATEKRVAVFACEHALVFACEHKRMFVGCQLHGCERPVGMSKTTAHSYRLPEDFPTEPMRLDEYRTLKLRCKTPEGTKQRSFRVLRGIKRSQALRMTLREPERFWH